MAFEEEGMYKTVHVCIYMCHSCAIDDDMALLLTPGRSAHLAGHALVAAGSSMICFLDFGMSANGLQFGAGQILAAKLERNLARFTAKAEGYAQEYLTNSTASAAKSPKETSALVNYWETLLSWRYQKPLQNGRPAFYRLLMCEHDLCCILISIHNTWIADIWSALTRLG